jgi:hypothetical protein
MCITVEAEIVFDIQQKDPMFLHGVFQTDSTYL